MLSPNTQANAMTRYRKYSEISISISYGQATLWVWVMLSNLWMGDHKQISSWIGLEGIGGWPCWLQKHHHFLIATISTWRCWNIWFSNLIVDQWLQNKPSLRRSISSWEAISSEPHPRASSSFPLHYLQRVTLSSKLSPKAPSGAF